MVIVHISGMSRDRCWGDSLLPGPFTSERCLGTSSDRKAYAGTGICHNGY